MCQGKHSGNAIDILPSCKVTEDHFQMKPASLKRHNCLDSEKRTTETKLFSISELHGGSLTVCMGRRMKDEIKDGNLSKHHTP